MRRLGVVLVVAAASVLGLAVPALASYALTPKSTWAANGTVFALAVDGNAVYLGGKFTALKDPATGRTMAAQGLAALDRTTGEPIWTASANGEVRSLAVSASGNTLFVGGAFTAVNGVTANRLAALATATGSLVPNWQGSASGSVRDLTVAGPDLYAGGQFSQVNGARRGGLARLDASTGAVEPWKARTGGGRPWAIKLSADGTQLIVGGNFTSLAGASRTFLGSVSTATGQVTQWAPSAECATCYVFDVDVNDMGSYVASGGPGGRLTAYTSTGAAKWSVRADGNIQAVAVSDGLVYAGGHFDPDFGGQTRHQLAAVSASTGNVNSFAPEMTKPTPGVWALAALPDGLFAGGGFTGVGTATVQAHYAVFATQ